MHPERSMNGDVFQDVETPKFAKPPSSRFKTERVEQLWQLMGGHPRDFNEVAMRAELIQSSFLQAYAVGSVDSMEFMHTGRGQGTYEKMVGWARARFDEAVGGAVPFARIESVYVDPTVEANDAQDFLLAQLQFKVSRNARRVAGLLARVPSERLDETAVYLRRGFRDKTGSDDLVWTPE